MDLEVRLCAWEHHGVMTGKDAEDIVRRGIGCTLDLKRRIAGYIEEWDDTEKVVRWLTTDWLVRSQLDFLSYDIMVHIIQRIVHNATAEDVSTNL